MSKLSFANRELWFKEYKMKWSDLDNKALHWVYSTLRQHTYQLVSTSYARSFVRNGDLDIIRLRDENESIRMEVFIGGNKNAEIIEFPRSEIFQQLDDMRDHFVNVRHIPPEWL
jgi:hypothetical protein